MSTRTVTVKNTFSSSSSSSSFSNNSPRHQHHNNSTSHSKHMNNHPSCHNKNSKKMNHTNSSPPPRQYNNTKKDETKKLQATHRKNRRHQNKDHDDSSSNSGSGSDSDSYKSSSPRPKRKPSPSFDSKSKLNSFGSSMTDQVYAGPTFNNAPVPSALPIPAFNARGSPISNHPQPLYMSATPSLQQQSKDLMNLLLPPQPISRKVVSAYELEQDLALSEIQRGLRSMLKITS